HCDPDCRCRRGDDDIDLESNEFLDLRLESRHVVICPAILDDNIAPVHVPQIAQAPQESLFKCRGASPKARVADAVDLVLCLCSADSWSGEQTGHCHANAHWNCADCPAKSTGKGPPIHH